MRRLMLLPVFLLTLCFLTGCTPRTDLYGCWVTSPEETLCSAVLYLDSDSQFTLIQGGVTTTGKWTLHGLYVTLNTDDQHSISLLYKVGALTMDDLTLYRQPSPDIPGYWMSSDDDIPGRTILLLTANGDFSQETTHSDTVSDIVLDGGKRLYGSWELQGRLLVLRCADGSTLQYRLSLDGTSIDMGNGVLLTNMRIPD